MSDEFDYNKWYITNVPKFNKICHNYLTQLNYRGINIDKIAFSDCTSYHCMLIKEIVQSLSKSTNNDPVKINTTSFPNVNYYILRHILRDIAYIMEYLQYNLEIREIYNNNNKNKYIIMTITRKNYIS
jgi:hypothetical protein